MGGRVGLAMAVAVASTLLACGGEDTTERGAGNGQGASAGQGAGAVGANADQSGFGNRAGAPPTMINTLPNGQNASDVCEKQHVTADPQTPEMMIVLDRSGSMQDGMRWTPSVSALRSVTKQLETKISFGMALFPDPNPNTGGVFDCITAPDPQMCANAISCGVGKVVVQPMIGNATAIDTALGGTMPGGGTPTPETLQSLVDTYASPPDDPDALPVPKFVLLVTDGQPTCPTGNGQQVTQTDIDASNAAIEALAEKGVRTYVIGYDTATPGNEMLKTVLDGFAQRGGTGDTEHHPVEDEASLLAVLESITAKIASCTFQLEMAPPRPDYVRVEVDGKQINLGDPDGWQLVGDRTVELQGGACMSLMTVAAHAINVEVECDVVPPS